MGAHENDRFGFFKTRSEFAEDADVRIVFRRLEREHGRAVRKKERRLSGVSVCHGSEFKNREAEGLP